MWLCPYSFYECTENKNEVIKQSKEWKVFDCVRACMCLWARVCCDVCVCVGVHAHMYVCAFDCVCCVCVCACVRACVCVLSNTLPSPPFCGVVVFSTDIQCIQIATQIHRLDASIVYSPYLQHSSPSTHLPTHAVLTQHINNTHTLQHAK